jgi:hypothetical protein
MRNWFATWQINNFYKKDQQGILNRFFRESNAWNNHLNKTKAFIINHTKNKQFNKVAILGSGWLLDVPLEQLLAVTKELHAFDILHPVQIRNKYKANSNLKFFTHDLSFGLVNTASECKSVHAFRQQCNAVVPDIDFDAYDLVISLNLLNQLDILLLDFLQKRFFIHDADQAEIRKSIQDKHIQTLPKGKSMLVSDWFENNWTKIQERDSAIGKPLIYSDLLNQKSFESWVWDFDNKKMYRKKINTSFTVRAYCI